MGMNLFGKGFLWYNNNQLYCGNCPAIFCGKNKKKMMPGKKIKKQAERGGEYAI